MERDADIIQSKASWMMETVDAIRKTALDPSPDALGGGAREKE
jgi:hypothetical protein